MERLAFIEQMAGAPPTHAVVDSLTGAELYRGAEASARLLYEAFMAQYLEHGTTGIPELHPLPSERSHHIQIDGTEPSEESSEDTA